MAEATDINVDELRRRARRRLIGAIVLALAAAVIVPMLLESDPKPLGEDVSVKIPQQDNDKIVNRACRTKVRKPARDRARRNERNGETSKPARGACSSKPEACALEAGGWRRSKSEAVRRGCAAEPKAWFHSLPA